MKNIVGMCRRAECKIGDKLHKSEHLFHFAYLGAIMVEGHGIVSIFAGGGFVALAIYMVLYAQWGTD